MPKKLNKYEFDCPQCKIHWELDWIPKFCLWCGCTFKRKPE